MLRHVPVKYNGIYCNGNGIWCPYLHWNGVEYMYATCKFDREDLKTDREAHLVFRSAICIQQTEINDI